MGSLKFRKGVVCAARQYLMTTIRVSYKDKDIELPVLDGVLGNSVLDIRQLSKVGLFTYDPGFSATAACKSSITYIDGERGLLYYRGYPIEQIAEKSDYLETCYLLFYGERPNPEQRAHFNRMITRHSMIQDQMLSLYKGFRRDSHPMSVIIGVIGVMSAFYHDSLNDEVENWREITAHRLISKMPNIIAQAYRYGKGLPFSYPRNDLSYAENFLHMMFSIPCESYVVNPVLAKALDRIFILHADHEQNASTSTVRLAGSSGANPFACIAAGVACLWGPAHGGANEAVLNMLDSVGSVDKIPELIASVKRGERRLMGFGHRVYKNMDPRARIMKQTCKEVLDELSLKDHPKFKLAMELEKIALNDEYFINHKLYPNVDFYSGIVLSAMGFPVRMFTPLFALARTVGWISHWNEMIDDKESKIGRPRQLYVGQCSRNFK